MSYCRWSTDDFLCDLYVYHSVGDFYSINVADRRRVYRTPPPPPVDWTPGGSRAWFDRYDAMNAMKEGKDYDLVEIGLPYDGETFNEPTIPDAIARLEALRAAGYRFPDHVLDELREELATGDQP